MWFTGGTLARMERTTVTLDVTEASSEYSIHSVRWFRSRFTPQVVPFLDWAIDGTALREMCRWSDGELPQEVTTLANPAASREFAAQSLRALLGGPEHPEFWTRMADGRVPLLYCICCYDLECRTLTAEVAILDETVEWRDVGWQVGYEPYDRDDQELRTFTLVFERRQYESRLAELLQQIGSSK